MPTRKDSYSGDISPADRRRRSRHRAYLIRKIAWQLQALAEGGLTERARRRARDTTLTAFVRPSLFLRRTYATSAPRIRTRDPVGMSRANVNSSLPVTPPPVSVSLRNALCSITARSPRRPDRVVIPHRHKAFGVLRRPARAAPPRGSASFLCRPGGRRLRFASCSPC